MIVTRGFGAHNKIVTRGYGTRYIPFTEPAEGGASFYSDYRRIRALREEREMLEILIILARLGVFD